MIIMNCVNFLLWVDGMVMWYRDVYYWITDRHWIKQKQMFFLDYLYHICDTDRA